MINSGEEFEKLVDEANAKMDQADLVKNTNPELYTKLYEEAGEILDTARGHITM